MSRQYDEAMEGTFEVYGETYRLVEPTSFSELAQAIRIRDILQDAINSMMHDEDSSGYASLLEEQEGYIREYVESLGEFDNGLLASNIAYLTRVSRLRLGDLEKLLGISAGYISRTTKENSAKKLSIDVAWKIAKVFGVSLQQLIAEDLSIPNSNTHVAERFVSKLAYETENLRIKWKSRGGYGAYLDADIVALKIAAEDDKGSIFYPDHMNPQITFRLTGEIFGCTDVIPGKEILIAPFGADEKDLDRYYEFILIWDDPSNPLGVSMQRMFTSSDDPGAKLPVLSAQLYSRITNLEFDTEITHDVKKMLIDYLKRNK